jgi:CO/xanthine dehydrogenase Mo-binding subunit
LVQHYKKSPVFLGNPRQLAELARSAAPPRLFEGGRVFVKADGSADGVPFADLLRRANLRFVTGSGKSEATFGNPDAKFSTHSFGCHFVEITWQPEIARLRVTTSL